MPATGELVDSWAAAELAERTDEGVLEQAPVMQILQEGDEGLVVLRQAGSQIFLDRGMVIPPVDVLLIQIDDDE